LSGFFVDMVYIESPHGNSATALAEFALCECFCYVCYCYELMLCVLVPISISTIYTHTVIELCVKMLLCGCSYNWQ